MNAPCLDFNQAAQAVMDQVTPLADRLGGKPGAKHLLLALLRAGNSRITAPFHDLGVDADHAQDLIERNSSGWNEYLMDQVECELWLEPRGPEGLTLFSIATSLLRLPGFISGYQYRDRDPMRPKAPSVETVVYHFNQISIYDSHIEEGLKKSGTYQQHPSMGML